jgi:hypothetical protein
MFRSLSDLGLTPASSLVISKVWGNSLKSWTIR